MPLDSLAGQLGARNATHLLRRATFGPTPQDISTFASMDTTTALNTLFQSVDPPEPPIDPATGETWLNPASTGENSSQENLIDYFMAWHLEQMRKSGNSIKERIVWFLHTHLPVRRSVVPVSEHLYYQNALFRYYAFGSFKTLFKKVVLDNAMMLFIDNATNDVASPNENFAREMFELYSIGRGPQIAEGNYTHYTEDDIKEATRVLTGYEVDESFGTIDPDTGLPTSRLKTVLSGGDEIANRHDAGEKQFSAAFQNQVIAPATLVDGYATKEAAEAELDEMIEMIFAQEETAKFLVRKLYRFFVYYEITPEVESNIIEPLADTFRTSDYNLEAVLRDLLASEHFYDSDNGITDDDNNGALIKSPLEVILGTCRLFEVEFPADETMVYQDIYQGDDQGILAILENQGIPFYEPYDVAGFEAYFQFPNFNRNWITPYSMAYRYSFSVQLLNGVNAGEEPLGIQFDFFDWFLNSGHITQPGDAYAMLGELTDLLFPFDVSDERRDYFINEVMFEGLYQAPYWAVQWQNYQNDPAGHEEDIRNYLNRLFHGLIQTPEYQLF